MTLVYLIDRAKSYSLTYNIVAPTTSNITIPPFNCTPTNPHILFLLNFTTSQRSALLHTSLALLYTPNNEHFGIGPVEGMLCGLPVLACNTGGPTESIVDIGHPPSERTGWLRPPEAQIWADGLLEIINLAHEEREALAERCRVRAREMFGMNVMAKGVEKALMDAAEMGPVPDSGILNFLLSVVGFCFAYVVGMRLLFPPQ
jgi:alpha-1,3/alpha-1,6-mannosyltransferase